jgi:acyl carrier protein
MTKETAYTRLAAMLETDFQVPSEKIAESAELRTELGLDSLALTDLALLIQTDFDFDSEPDAFMGLSTVGALAEFVATHAP